MTETTAAQTADAPKLVSGRVLLTKDGRRIGNAVIETVAPHVEHGQVYAVRTDFGNRTVLTGAEVLGLFHLGPVQKLDRRARDQADLRAGRTPEPDPDDFPIPGADGP